MLSDAELAEMRAVNRAQRNLTDDARLRERGIELRHPAKPPHEQWMHAGKAKAVAKTAKKLLAALGVEPDAKPISHRVAGTDKIEELKADSIQLYGRPSIGPVDEVLGRIAAKQGFGGSPAVGSADDLDRAIESGWIEAWRGVRGDGRGQMPEDINGRLRYGDFQPGHGLYGNGLYASPRVGTAETFAGSKKLGDATADYDSIIRMAIDPSARIVDYDELLTEYKAWLKTQPNKGKLTDAEMMRLPTTPEVGANKVFTDIGRYAAARGYDVIRIGPKHDDGGEYRRGEQRQEQYNVLNRTVLLIQEPIQ